MTTQDTTSTGHSAVAARAVIDQMTEALGGRLALESAAAEVITATGWRRHPGWGTEPLKPEAAAHFTYTLRSWFVCVRLADQGSRDERDL